jgi:integrase
MKTEQTRETWNKGKLIGQKPPLKPKDVWAIRIHLQNAHAVRDLALFNLAIDTKLRGCDLVSLRVRDVTHGNQVLPRALIVQRKTQRPVQFELTEPTRLARGLRRLPSGRSNTFSLVDYRRPHIFQPGNMPG